MSESPPGDSRAPDAGALKAALDVDKLTLDIAAARRLADAAERDREKAVADLEKLHLDNEKARRREGFDALEQQKIQLEIRALRQKVRGRERVGFWQKVQYGVIIIGVAFSAASVWVSISTYKKALDDAAKRDFQNAVEHFGKGWPAGALELSERGADGLQALVYGIDPTGERNQASWPLVTEAALDQLARKQSGLTPEEKAALAADVDRSDRKIRQQLLLIDRMPPPADEKAEAGQDAALALLSDLVCIQSKLQKVAPAPPDWSDTQQRADIKLVGRAHC